MAPRLPRGVATWAQVMDVTRRYAHRLGPGSWHELRFEDLVADPEPRLFELCRYLGEEYALEMTEPHRPPVRPSPPAGPGTGAPTAPWTPRVRVAGLRLTADQIRLSETAMGRRSQRHGHE